MKIFNPASINKIDQKDANSLLTGRFKPLHKTVPAAHQTAQLRLRAVTWPRYYDPDDPDDPDLTPAQRFLCRAYWRSRSRHTPIRSLSVEQIYERYSKT